LLLLKSKGRNKKKDDHLNEIKLPMQSWA